MLRISHLGMMLLSLGKSFAKHFRHLGACNDVRCAVNNGVVVFIVDQFCLKVCSEFVGWHPHFCDYRISIAILLFQYAQQKVLRSDSGAIKPYGLVATTLEYILYLF